MAGSEFTAEDRRTLRDALDEHITTLTNVEKQDPSGRYYWGRQATLDLQHATIVREKLEIQMLDLGEIPATVKIRRRSAWANRVALTREQEYINGHR